MDKKTYYVSVQSGSIVQDEGATPFEFEIQATDKEVNKLQYLFEEKEDADSAVFSAAFLRSAIPFKDDLQNGTYDASLKDVYKMIYELGTESTKKHIEEMNVLQ